MARRAGPALILFVLLALLAGPVAAQVDPSAAPETAAPSVPAATPASSAPPASSAAPSPSVAPSQLALPTAMPVSDGALAQSVLFFSPSCGHCHYVITEILPDITAAEL